MRYPITKFLEGRGQWWYVNAVFNEQWRTQEFVFGGGFNKFS